MQRALTAVVLAAAAPALATDVYYSDCSSISPSGRYRIDAKSPYNAGPHRRPFAQDFTYTLTDTATGRTLWQRHQPRKRGKGDFHAWSAESSPVSLFVNDAGLVAVRTAADSLVLLEPATGRKRAEADILKAFPQEQRDHFVSRTTAGPMWSHESEWYFLDVAARDRAAAVTYFVVRPYWNHRLVVNTATGAHVDLGPYHGATATSDFENADPELADLLTAILKEETRRALGRLSQAIDTPALVHVRGRDGLTGALRTVSLLRLTEAEHQLRTIEARLGVNNDDDYSVLEKLRESLRAIGATPAPGFGFPLFPRAGEPGAAGEPPFRRCVPNEDRVANAGRIVAGMSARELTDLIGCPDAMVFDRTWSYRCYDYDIDASEGYTLRISLSPDGQTVIRVKTIVPFAFLHDPDRQFRMW